MIKRKDVMASKPKNKFEPNQMSPYIIDKVYEGGTYTVVNHEGDVAFPPLNGKHMKMYYAPDHEFYNE